MTIRTFIAISLFILSGLSHAQAERFSNLYLGVAPGILVGGVNLTSTHLAFTLPSNTCNSNATFSSFTPSVLLGYSYEFDFGGVTGLELDFSYNSSQTTNLACPCLTNPRVSDRLTFSNQLQGSVRGRFGYTFLERSLLAFVSVGGSLANLGLTYTNERSGNFGTSVAVPGWLVGTGAEWRFVNDMSLRGEYHYTSYNSVRLALPLLFALNDPNGGAQAAFSAHNLRVTLNYWFF
jgi:opacity protein-like surface antigen